MQQHTTRRQVFRIGIPLIALGLSFVGLWSTVQPARALGHVYLVTNTGDNNGVNPAPGAGTGTLRQAIVDANANATLLNGEPHNIQFNIPGNGVRTIALSTMLPDITRPTIVDGATQPGSVCGTLVPLNASGAITQSGQTPHTLNIEIQGGSLNFNVSAAGSGLRGLALAQSVNMSAPNSLVECNYFGANSSGVSQAIFRPLTVGATADDTEVRNNLFASAINWWVGVRGKSADNLSGVNLHNNLIGTSPDGRSANTTVLEAQTSGLSAEYTSDLAVKDNIFASVLATVVPWCARITTSQNPTVRGNYFGWAVDGRASLGGCQGFTLEGVTGGMVGGSDATDRNYFSNTTLSLIGGSGIAAKGNYFGFAPDGETIEQNLSTGIRIGGGSSHFIGGLGADDGNVVAAKAPAKAIDISSNSSNFTVQGNYIGVTPDGRLLPKAQAGIILNNAGSGLIDKNVVTNSTGAGIDISGQQLPLTIKRNLVGLAGDGVTAVPNDSDGIRVSGGNVTTGSVMIGGSQAGDGNYVAANSRYGISTYFSTVSITVYGNKIGVAKDGSLKGNKWDGIRFNDGSPEHGNPSGVQKVGGTNPGEGNEIAGNGRSGVFQSYDGNPNTYGVGLTVRGNSIHDNAWPGILLGRDSTALLANDSQDPDEGPNHLQNYPVVNQTMQSCSGQTSEPVSLLNSTPNTPFTIDYYANPSWDSSSGVPRQGEQWVSSETVTTDANGNAMLRIPSDIVNPSATATNPQGSTSEFGSVNNIKFTDCQDMLQRQVATTSEQDFELSADWTGENIPVTEYRNWPTWDPASNADKDNIKKTGMTVSITVGGRPFVPTEPLSQWSTAYDVQDWGWSAYGHTAAPLPEGEYDVILTVTNPVSGFSMTKTYPKAVKVVLPRVNYTTTFTNNQTPTLTGTASGYNEVNSAYILPKGTTPAPDTTLWPADQGFYKKRIIRYVADINAQGNRLDTGSFKVITNKTEYKAALVVQYSQEAADVQADFEKNFAQRYLSRASGVDTPSITTLDGLKGLCTNQAVIDQLNIYIGWGYWQSDPLTSASDCQNFFQTQYDQIKPRYDQYLTDKITALDDTDPTSYYNTYYDFSSLPEGEYDVYFMGADLSGQSFTRDFPGGLVIDLTAPTVTVTVDSAQTNISPQLNGTVSEPYATVRVTIRAADGTTYGPYVAINNGDGTWTLPAGTIQPSLVLGVYTVTAEATDLAGQSTTYATNLTIVTTQSETGRLSPTGANMLVASIVAGGLVVSGTVGLKKWRITARNLTF